MLDEDKDKVIKYSQKNYIEVSPEKRKKDRYTTSCFADGMELLASSITTSVCPFTSSEPDIFPPLPVYENKPIKMQSQVSSMSNTENSVTPH